MSAEKLFYLLHTRNGLKAFGFNMAKRSAANRPASNGDSKRSKVEREITSLADLSSEDEIVSSDPNKSDDDEELENDGSEEESDEQPSHDRTRQTLSAQDVQVAKETSELFKSNIFKMQIDELLKELKLNEKHTQELDRLLFRLNHSFEDIKELTDLSISEAEKLFNRELAIPFPDPKPTKDVKYKFGFGRPENVNIVGSYSLKTAARQPEGVCVDMVVTMPASLFQEKDYLNYRYFHKRAFYVACLAKHLKAKVSKDDFPFNIRYSYIDSDMLRPVLSLEITQSKLSKFHISILIGAPNGLFEPRKLSPDRNCVRLQDSANLPPTLLYNSALLTDTRYLPYLEYLHKASHLCEAFTDACKLGRLWLRQRGFGSSSRRGGFGHFEWSMLMAALLEGGGVNGGNRVLMNGYSSYQMFKATLAFLASQDISLKALTFSLEPGKTTKLESAKFSAPAILFDRDAKLNVFWKLSCWSYKMLRHEATVATDLLTDVVKDRFYSIFLTPFNPRLRFDSWFKVTIPGNDEWYSSEERVRYPSFKQFYFDKLYRLLDRALEGRARQIALFSDPPKSWSINRRKGTDSVDHIFVGLILDPAECEKLVTYGPSTEETEATEQFRKFWGRKSELRRFQDASIKETVVWKHHPTKPVVNSIISYVLDLHLPGSVAELHDELLGYIPSQINVPGAKERSVTSTQLFQLKYASFQQAANLMQSLSELPLRIRAVLPTSSSLRFTSVTEPCGHDFSTDDCIASGVIDLESSGKWPDELQASEKTKTAFLLKIAEEIEKAGEGHVTMVGVEEFIAGLEVGFLQLQTPQGFSFKFRIRTDRDDILYSRMPHNDEAVEQYKQKYSCATTHNRAVHTLSLRYPHYSATARLLKVWFKSQLLLSHIPEEVVELVALKPFVESAPYAPPSSVVTAFYRVINFLAYWNWREEPLILDVEKTSDSSKDEAAPSLVEGIRMDMGLFQKLSDAFAKHRAQDPALTHSPMFIGTKYDLSGTLWTQVLPRSDIGRVVASRVTALSRAVDDMITDGNVDYSLIFSPSLKEYDLVFHIQNPSAEQSAVNADRYKNLQLLRSITSHKELVHKSVNVGEEFYEDLRQKYEGSLILFYGGSPDDRKNRRQIIAGIWHKDIVDARKFKVNLYYSTMPRGADLVELNKEAVVEEIRRIGGDLIEMIELR
jgi:U3 small nucleolar RNA-associated protein 22